MLRKFATTIGDGSSTVISVPHNLNTRDVVIQVHDEVGMRIKCGMASTDELRCTLKFSSPPPTDMYRVVVLG